MGKKALSVTWWSIIISSFCTSQLKKNSFFFFFLNVTLCLLIIHECLFSSFARFRCLCCCIAGGQDTDDAFSDVSRLVADYFKVWSNSSLILLDWDWECFPILATASAMFVFAFEENSNFFLDKIIKEVTHIVIFT